MNALDATDADRRQRHDSCDCSEGCPVEAAPELIGGKWKGLALYHLMDGPIRFNELKRQMGEVTPRIAHLRAKVNPKPTLRQRKRVEAPSVVLGIRNA